MSLGVLAFLGTVTAALADWRYCYGLDEAAGHFYISRPAFTYQPFEEVNEAFRRLLAANEIQAHSVACPRAADLEEIERRAEHARTYNRRNGNVVVPVDWSPESIVALPRR